MNKISVKCGNKMLTLCYVWPCLPHPVYLSLRIAVLSVDGRNKGRDLDKGPLSNMEAAGLYCFHVFLLFN